MGIREIEKLMLRLKSGDKSALGEIYDSTHQAVYLAALRVVGIRAVAEDISQNVYLRLAQKIDLYESGNAVGFLITMSKRLAYNELKSRSKTILTDYSDFDIADQHDFTSAPETPLLDFALKYLPEDEYEILIMAEISGFKRREIAKILAVPLSTVTYKYLKAVKYLKTNFKN